MALALFDLDNTLIAGDSDFLWGRFLVERGLVDADAYDAANRAFYQQYVDGTLDMDAYLRFALDPLTRHPPEVLAEWRTQFITEYIEPALLPAGQQLVAEHRRQGDTTVIITATNRFITEPIAGYFEVDALLATTPARRDGWYTGGVEGPVTFAGGKITALEEWMEAHGGDLAGSHFYSDSHNDLPLLERVEHPVAVDPDPTLERAAAQRGWRCLSLRGAS